MGQDSRLSIFSHAAYRGTAVAYLLGAVVPLVALGIITERYVLGPITTPMDDSSAISPGWAAALFVQVGLLSLGCFFMLRTLVKKSLEENRALAYYDSLTGLPNRRLFEDRLEQVLSDARRRNQLVAVCFIDLDDFKRVNDTLGHGAGDRLLCEVSDRLKRQVRTSDTVARAQAEKTDAPTVSRLGGDEFTILLTGISDSGDAGRVARRVIEAMAAPIELEGREVFTSASIGIAVYPADGEEADELRRNADTALYWAKDRGRNNYQFYSSHMNEDARRKLELERRLRRAIQADELSLAYQPVLDARSRRVVCAEALLRWVDPEEGAISPGEFVPIAEDTGLIVGIGEWVLGTACRQLSIWERAGHREIRMAVNISGHQLRHPSFTEMVARAVEEYGIGPGRLELEITESTIMQDDDVTAAALQTLDELGIGVVLDDFGTGYSSLSYLRRFPISRLKIDRSFVAELPENREDVALTSAVVTLAHGLEIPVVAEGVETGAQAEFLRHVGCQDLQGHFFSMAVTPEEFIGLLEDEKGTP